MLVIPAGSRHYSLDPRDLTKKSCHLSTMQVRVRVSRDFLELVEKNVLSSRPAGRVNASSIDNTADAALLIADHSLFSGTYFIPLLTII
jgi:hypothetical protein